MKAWSKSKIATIVSLGLVVVVIVLWITNQYGYKTVAAYRCDKRGERVIHQPNIFQDTLEFYVGGWIERGDVTISGLPSRENEMLKFSRSVSVTTISHAYIGEWYEPNIKIIFDPTEGSSCLIRMVYKFR